MGGIRESQKRVRKCMHIDTNKNVFYGLGKELHVWAGRYSFLSSYLKNNKQPLAISNRGWWDSNNYKVLCMHNYTGGAVLPFSKQESKANITKKGYNRLEFSILSIHHKAFSSILNKFKIPLCDKLIQAWDETNNLTGHCQVSKLTVNNTDQRHRVLSWLWGFLLILPYKP